MLHLITGQNGSGKSLRAIELMYERHGQGMDVYASGFRALRAPFVKHFPDPRRWKELPPNSVLFIDEAQQVWRTRTSGRAVPQEILDLEVHRHQGIDIYLITQSPMYLDSHIRPLISSHEHLISYDKSSARIYRFSECYEDVKSSQLRSRAEFRVWPYPTQHYADYDSAEVHTAKAKIPWRQRIAKLMFVLAGLLIVGAIVWFFWGPDGKPDPMPASTEQAPRMSQSSFFGALGQQATVVEGPRYADNVDYIGQHSARIPQMPWSAPVFDDRGVQSDPQLYCMSSTNHDGSRNSCSCVTEQGTRWVLPVQECEQIARWGAPYNPYKAPSNEARQRGQQADSRRRNDADGEFRIMDRASQSGGSALVAGGAPAPGQ